MNLVDALITLDFHPETTSSQRIAFDKEMARRGYTKLDTTTTWLTKVPATHSFAEHKVNTDLLGATKDSGAKVRVNWVGGGPLRKFDSTNPPTVESAGAMILRNLLPRTHGRSPASMAAYHFAMIKSRPSL